MREIGSRGLVGALDLLLPLPLEEDEEADIAMLFTITLMGMGWRESGVSVSSSR